MIDRTTLPELPEGSSVTEGQRFVVRGSGFNKWPSELVLADFENSAINTAVGSQDIMRLVAKTDTELTFEVVVSYKYGAAHSWRYIASPFATPRELLSYESA